MSFRRSETYGLRASLCPTAVAGLPWGTTHAILMASAVIQEPFAVINADDFYGAESYRALARYLQEGTSDYAMVGYALRDTLSDFSAPWRARCASAG